MKSLTVLVFVGLCGLVYSTPNEKYTTKYDSVDIDKVLESDRLVEKYCKCLEGIEKNCPKDAEELKAILPDALKTNCTKCNDGQKQRAKKVIRFLIKNKRDCWDRLQKKYDSENVYVHQYAEELKMEGIVL